MTETGLLIALVAFLLLLFGFIWLVVRSSLRTIDDTPAAPAREPIPAPPEPETDMPPLPPEPEPEPTPEPPAAPAAAGAGAAGAVAAADAQDVPAPPEPAALDPDAVEAAGAIDDDGSPDSTGAFDLSKDVAPRLIVESGTGLTIGDEIPLEGGLTIGRAGGSDLCLDDEFTSHTHASIVRRGQFYFISDLGSTNGTFLNDRRVTDDAQLRVRDVLRLGDTRLRYEE